MQIQDEIFQEFFTNLRNTGVPSSRVDELKTLWEEGQSFSIEQLLNLIQNHSKDGSQDK